MASPELSTHPRPRPMETPANTRGCPRPGPIVASLFLAAFAVMAFWTRLPVPISCSGPAMGRNNLDAGSLTFEYDPSQYATGVIYRSGNPTSEGYGTWFQQYKSALCMALFLRKTLIIQDVTRSQHGYFVSPQINAVHALPETPANYSENVCVHPFTWDWGGDDPHLYEKDMLNLMCIQLSSKSFKDPADMLSVVGNDTARTWAASAALARWKAEFEKCPEIHAHGAYGREELYNDCVQPWLSYTLRGMFSNRGFTSDLADNGCLNVGIHIRWGDLANPDNEIKGKRNLKLEEITQALSMIKQVTSQCPPNYHIFAKNATQELVEQLGIKHRLVDGDDDLYDMFLYSLMDVYIQGVSSWAVMPTMVHTGRVLITNNPSHPKLQTTFREVNAVYHFADPTYMEHIARLRPLSAVRAGRGIRPNLYRRARDKLTLTL